MQNFAPFCVERIWTFDSAALNRLHVISHLYTWVEKENSWISFFLSFVEIVAPTRGWGNLPRALSSRLEKRKEIGGYLYYNYYFWILGKVGGVKCWRWTIVGTNWVLNCLFQTVSSVVCIFVPWQFAKYPVAFFPVCQRLRSLWFNHQNRNLLCKRRSKNVKIVLIFTGTINS